MVTVASEEPSNDVALAEKSDSSILLLSLPSTCSALSDRLIFAVGLPFSDTFKPNTKNAPKIETAAIAAPIPSDGA